MGLFKPSTSAKTCETAKAERGKRYLCKDADRSRKRDPRAEESLEDPTVTEARISLDDTYYGS
jgi:hypothetical protein